MVKLLENTFRAVNIGLVNYLSWKAQQSGFEARFIDLAGHVNGAMPQAVVQKIGDAFNTRRKSVNGARILVAGRSMCITSSAGDSRMSSFAGSRKSSFARMRQSPRI